MAEESFYYIQDSRNYVGNSVQWWCVDGKGYTSDLKLAWRVPLAQARDICRSRATDVAWPCEAIDAVVQIHFDMQSLRGLKPLAKETVHHG